MKVVAMAEKLPAWITVDKASELSGYTPTHIRKMYLDGLITYTKRDHRPELFEGYGEKISVLVNTKSLIKHGKRTNRMKSLIKIA